MPPSNLDRIVDAIRASWASDTCDPVDLDRWSPGNPSRGQCGTTALVLHDLLGGDLMIAEVLLPDGSHQGFHYWNRLPNGTEVDLTLEQFDPDEKVQPGRVVSRPPGPPRRCADQYAVLRERVLRHIEVHADPALPR